MIGPLKQAPWARRFEGLRRYCYGIGGQNAQFKTPVQNVQGPAWRILHFTLNGRVRHERAEIMQVTASRGEGGAIVGAAADQNDRAQPRHAIEDRQ